MYLTETIEKYWIVGHLGSCYDDGSANHATVKLMPYIHTIDFPVRHYECDANGRVHPATILGYMQEAAFGASAAVGYSASRYAELGLQWFAYETEITFLRPLHYGDTVTINTWVVDFRRVRSQRNYELSVDGQIVARANTDWVMIDTEKMYPATIPDDIVAAYSQGEAVDEAPRRDSFPRFPDAPQSAFLTTRQVEWRDIDPAGHVNNAVYVHYVEEAERQAAASAGWSQAHFQVENAAIATRAYQIEYKIAALFGDTVTISTWASDVTPDGGTRYFLLNRQADGKLLARVRSEWGWIDTQTGDLRLLDESFIRRIR